MSYWLKNCDIKLIAVAGIKPWIFQSRVICLYHWTRVYFKTNFEKSFFNFLYIELACLCSNEPFQLFSFEANSIEWMPSKLFEGIKGLKNILKQEFGNLFRIQGPRFLTDAVLIVILYLWVFVLSQ